MGNDQGKQKKKFVPKNLDKSKLDIIIKQIYYTAQLNRDRRKGQQNTREKELLNLVREPANKRNRDNEYHKASAIVNDIKWIKAQEYVMRYSDIIKDNEMIIMLSKGDMTKINDLIPYVESIIWGCQKGNIECVRAFQEFIAGAFGLEILNQLLQFTKVTSEIKECYAAILPSEKEIKSYLIEFCGRNGISLETMNEIGHGLSLSALEDMPGPTNPSNPPTDPQYPVGGPGQQYPGNYPPNNYPNEGYSQPQNNYVPGGFSNNYPQGNNPQGGYPQNGYPQGGFPQNGYPQGGFPQNGYPQGGFPSGGYPQPGSYPGGNSQSGGGYPQFGDYNPQAGPYEPYKQAPETNFHAPSNLNVKVEQPQHSLPDSGAYPGFQKFTNNVPSAKVGGDPLDELDMRLKNIKNGL